MTAHRYSSVSAAKTINDNDKNEKINCHYFTWSATIKAEDIKSGDVDSKKEKINN